MNPENFLLASPAESSALKACDFGLSVFFRPGQKFSDFIGSPFYMAPEVGAPVAFASLWAACCPLLCVASLQIDTAQPSWLPDGSAGDGDHQIAQKGQCRRNRVVWRSEQGSSLLQSMP